MDRSIVRYIALLCLFLPCCRDKYNPTIRYPQTGFLVVEGFLNSGGGSTTIRLSRSLALNDTMAIQSETNAEVSVEGATSGLFNLAETASGIYTHPQLLLNTGEEYRLHIRTNGGKEYYSDYQKPVKSPSIDSLSWESLEKGVEISVNTHDPANSTRYYTWNFKETWEVDALYLPYVKYKVVLGKIVGLDYINENFSADTGGRRCWQYNSSTSILTGSSARLAEDVIHIPLQIIEPSSIKLGVLYHIRVFQHGLSAAGYDFLQRLKKNTEQTGSIFDSQPSQLNSNIHNVADPAEQVFGFVDVADQDSMDLFISNREVPRWGYNTGCFALEVGPYTSPDTLARYSYLRPIDFSQTGSYRVSLPECVDCRVQGSNIKPSYWPR